MSDDSENVNPDDLPPHVEIPPDVQAHLEEFERLMQEVNDPVANGYAVIAEMYNGFRTAGMERIDAYCLVAAYLVMHDHLGKEGS